MFFTPPLLKVLIPDIIHIETEANNAFDSSLHATIFCFYLCALDEKCRTQTRSPTIDFIEVEGGEGKRQS